MNNENIDQQNQQQQFNMLMEQLINLGRHNYHDEDAPYRCADYLRGVRCQNGDDCPRLHRLPRDDGI